ncbi:hypothetical protein TNCT_65541 [Trichonephila clavata]|uniref:Uncharacterized protein n=1 Tax=Trichonephila clavata TaxID=2740835 RepID=A0A8X6GHG4_TRICU|nr:hypothetical protein TNCT_65541 [Trichonephila clavata]
MRIGAAKRRSSSTEIATDRSVVEVHENRRTDNANGLSAFLIFETAGLIRLSLPTTKIEVGLWPCSREFPLS